MSAELPKDFIPPIIEAVLDIDCDLPPAVDLAALEAPARAAFRERYPKHKTQFLDEHTIEARAENPPKLSSRRGLQAFQFLQEDEKQLIQVRGKGYSFNRLAPYSSLDDYLGEIERSWRQFVELASPLQVRQVRLRYINRIVLPPQGNVDLAEYLAIGPRLPQDRRLTFVSFLDRHAAMDTVTGHRVQIILASRPAVSEGLPVILDIEVAADKTIDPSDWEAILGKIRSLRDLKNLVFRSTLTDRCLQLQR